MDDIERLHLTIRTLKIISSIADNLSSIECCAREYILDEDEFGNIMYIRDLADKCIRDIQTVEDENGV